MEDFQSIFKRMDIRQLRTFLLCGVDDSETDTRNYEQRLKEKDDIICKRIEAIYPADGKERDDLFSDLSEALVIREQIYLEIGIKAGARLLWQLLSMQ